MPVLVHLTPEPQARHILRVGIRAARLRAHPAGRGVFCSPILPNFFVSHQWLRELKRGGQRTFVAIDFRLRDDEPVWVGHYGQPHVETTAGEAVGVIMRQEDPRGYEVIVPRSVEAGEILGMRAVPQVTGWRYYPNAKGKAPCTCDYCNKGQIKGGRLWRRASRSSV